MGRRGRGEGTIGGPRPDGLYYAAMSRGPGRKREWFYGRTREEVRRKLTHAMAERDLGVRRRSSDMKVGPYLVRWIGEREEQARGREATLRGYRRIIELHLVPHLGQVRLRDLEIEEVERMLFAIRKTRSSGTVNNIRSVLRKALHDAIRHRLLIHNVAALAEQPRISRRESKFLTASQARGLLAAVAGDRLEAFFSAGMALGMRPSEILGLQWSDIDDEAHELRVQRQLVWLPARPPRLLEVKTDKGRRRIHLPDVALEALRAHRARQAAEQLASKRWTGWRPEGSAERVRLVFTDEVGGPLRLDAVRRRFYRLLAAAGIPRVRLYEATRHTCASLLVAQNIHPKVAQVILGHANIQTTLELYSHVSDEGRRGAAAAIDRGLSGEP